MSALPFVRALDRSRWMVYCGGIGTLPSPCLLLLSYSSFPFPYSSCRFFDRSAFHALISIRSAKLYLRSSGEVVEGVWTNCFH